MILDGKDLVNVGNGRVFVARFRPGHFTPQVFSGQQLCILVNLQVES